MESILEWIGTEGRIFKRGSGAGVNLSPLRSAHETLSQGGHSSGPVSFMRGADAVAGSIASGGATRRAAKMVVLNIEHHDIMRFVRCKADEEKKVRALIEQGYNMYDLNNEGWTSIQYQNANNSVRVTDEFMQAVEHDERFSTRYVVSGKTAQEMRARELMKSIATAAWECGDPGIQYDTTINRWHTCPASGRINASNPCSEYMSVDNSACNLASINLLQFLNDDGTFNVRDFIHTVHVMVLAQEIVVDFSSYPTEKIEKNAHALRQLGLGYANLGALLMSLGIPYDSEEARHSAAAITGLMTGEAYKYSGLIAERMGVFAAFEENKDTMLGVLEMHRDALARIRQNRVFDMEVYDAAKRAWDRTMTLARKNGMRNSQVSLLAPTGTIAFMMDCATTGIEPEFALVKTKYLVGGGSMRLVNTTVPAALRKLAYGEAEVGAILHHIEQAGMIEGAPGLRDEHLAVFDCAVKPAGGKRSIQWQGHVKMVAAVQPFLSGAVSKTFNMPPETTVEEITDAFMMGWKLGLKAFAVYRDGSKAAQPLQTSGSNVKKDKDQKLARRHLPATRQSETHRFSIAGHEGYFTYSMFEEGTPAELFVRMSKQGSTLAGLLDTFAIAVSVSLQYGVPFPMLAKKFAYARFEPAGYTDNPNIPVATSIIDYIFRYLSMRFLSEEELEDLGMRAPAKELQGSMNGNGQTAPMTQVNAVTHDTSKMRQGIDAATFCKQCGGIMIQTGTCKTCSQCGTSNGGC